MYSLIKQIYLLSVPNNLFYSQWPESSGHGNVAKQKSAALSRADDSGHYYCYCPFQYVMQLSKYIRHSSLKYENRFKTLVHLALGWKMNLMKIDYHFIQLSLKNI